jgi:rubrerythrin
MDLNLILGALLGAGMIAFLLVIRPKDIPKPAPESPFKHLEERKAAIYENLRDLQFEYRLDKLSDQDYQATKLELQKDLAHIMAETDRIKTELGVKPQPVAAQPKKPACASCGATFDKAPKFCPECGKPVAA